MADTVQVGDGRTIQAVLTGAGGAQTSVDTADVHLTIKAPDGTETTYTDTALSESAGVVTYSHVFTMPGTWHWTFEWSDGTNPPQVAEGSQFVEVPRTSRQHV